MLTVRTSLSRNSSHQRQSCDDRRAPGACKDRQHNLVGVRRRPLLWQPVPETDRNVGGVDEFGLRDAQALVDFPAQDAPFPLRDIDATGNSTVAKVRRFWLAVKLGLKASEGGLTRSDKQLLSRS